MTLEERVCILEEKIKLLMPSAVATQQASQRHNGFVLDVITEYADNGISRGELNRKTSKMLISDRNAQLNMLLDSNVVYSKKLVIQGSQKPSTFYFLTTNQGNT